MLFSPLLFRCTYFFLGVHILISPWQFSFTTLLLQPLFCTKRFTIRYHCCAYRFPLLVASCLPLVQDGVPLLHFYCFFFGSRALSLRCFLLSFDFPYLLRVPFARCAVYPSLVHLPLVLVWPSGLVFYWDSLSLWEFPWVLLLILRLSSSFKVVQYFLLLPFLLPCVLYSLRIFGVLLVSGDSCLVFSAIIRSRLPLSRRFASAL